MKTNITVVILFLGTFFHGQIKAQTYDANNDTVQTFAGYGIPAYVDGPGAFSAFWSPSLIVSDTASNLFVWDSQNYRVRKISPLGMVSTFAGGGTAYNGFGTNVSLGWGSVNALTIDHSNKLWLLMTPSYGPVGNWLLSIDTNGYVAVENGGLTNLTSSSGLCFDSANNLYYSGGNRVYRYNLATQTLQPFAGNGVAANFDGQGTVFSAFNNPTALTCDQADNIYVWDSGNGTVRRIDQGQNVKTIAGTGNYYFGSMDGVGTNAGFNGVTSIFADQTGNIYFVCGSCVRKMDAQENVVTLAGIFNQYSSSFANGPGASARFSSAISGCFSQGMVFVADAGNNRIRSISFNSPSQIVPPANLQLQTYPGLQITGTVGRTYDIQSSADMTTWNTTATVLLSSSPFLWIDSNPANGKKFYRAVMR